MNQWNYLGMCKHTFLIVGVCIEVCIDCESLLPCQGQRLSFPCIIQGHCFPTDDSKINVICLDLRNEDRCNMREPWIYEKHEFTLYFLGPFPPSTDVYVEAMRPCWDDPMIIYQNSEWGIHIFVYTRLYASVSTVYMTLTAFRDLA